MSIIAVFPGQGSQTIGMGVEVSKTIKSAKNVLDEVDDALNFKLSKVMEDGNEETLRLTKNAQPAIMATGIAIVRAIEEISGKKISQIVSHSAGHSLGEYTALVSAGSISISDAAKLLRIRGKAMQNAVPVGLGSMVAILGVTIEDIEHFIGSVGNRDGLVEIANDNAPGQVVISGDVKTLNSIIALAKESGVRKIIKLSVSAPFHCSLMKSAADTMEKAFQDVNILEPKFPIISNVSAIPETSPQIIKNNLILQVTKTVRWRETMVSLSRLGVSQIVEMGTGKVLTGLAKRGVNNLSALNLETSEDIKKWLNAEKLI
jgi:[acyl-carrier-protein] S-malonyltransferase